MKSIDVDDTRATMDAADVMSCMKPGQYVVEGMMTAVNRCGWDKAWIDGGIFI